MAAPGNIDANFRNNFCSKPFTERDDPNLLHLEECRIRTRDVFRNVFSKAEGSEHSAKQKFNAMWRLKEKNWDDLTDQQKAICVDNLKWLNPELYEARQKAKLEREQWMPLYDISISELLPSDVLILKEELIEHGKVGIRADGSIVRVHDLDLDQENVVIIQLHPEADPPLHATMPHNDWHLRNGEDSSYWDIKKLITFRKVFPDQDNRFQLGSSRSNQFTIFYSKKPDPSSKRLKPLTDEYFIPEKFVQGNSLSFYRSVVPGAKREDPYSFLGLDQTATDEDIRKAYRKLGMKFHPDKNPSEFAEEAFKALGEAYRLIQEHRK